MKQLVIGMDIAKTVFQLHSVDTNGEVKRLKLQRNEVMPFFTQLAPAIVAMEACGGAHEWGAQAQCPRPSSQTAGAEIGAALCPAQ